MTNKKARVIAFYLPQYHPIPENDKWWGKGFTEWTNVGKAKPLFKGHYQPRVPADLGYYDLRMPEVRDAQAEMARNAGIEGFMYWHYWFGNGRTLLEKPFQEVLKSGKPDFPFCLGWANHSWENKTWHSAQQYRESVMLMEQLYPGVQDFKDHFYYVLKAFQDNRYIKIDGKPVFFIYNALKTELKIFIDVWQDLACKNGFDGIYFIGQIKRKEQHDSVFKLGFNGICRDGFLDTIDKINYRYFNSTLLRLKEKFKYLPLSKYEYSDFIKNFNFSEFDKKENFFPIIIPNYDHSPRSGRKGFILNNSTPELFRIHVRKTIEYIKDKDPDHKILFLRSWNEWAEGNYIEPDLVFKHGYLNALKEEIE